VALHLLPHYCFGTVNGADGMLLHVFFPNLRVGSHDGYNWISDNDLERWFEQLVIPARDKAIQDSNVLTHILPSHRLAKLNATAMAKETLTLSPAEHAVLWHDLYGAHGPLLPSRVRRALAR
jgi:hypothetical protein